MEKVKNPAHYVAKNGMQAIEVIESFELNFNLGNALKYILRAGKKDDTRIDLEKAAWYLNREIDEERKNEQITNHQIEDFLKHVFGTK